MIDLKNVKLSLRIREEKLGFRLAHAMAFPVLEDVCYRVDIIEKEVMEETMIPMLFIDPLEAYLIGSSWHGMGAH